MLNILKSDPGGKVDNLFSSAHVTEARRAEAWLEDRLRRGEHEVFAEVVTLTPAMAELLLRRNPDNRYLRPTKLEDFTTDIREGNWRLNGEPIIMSSDGLLNDGQHRCHAVIAAGRSILVLITFGYERDTRTTVDQGAARTPGDYLTMEGVGNANAMAAAAALLWQYQQRGIVSGSTHFRPTKAQVMEIVRSHPGLADSVKAIPAGAGAFGGKSLLAFCHYLFAQRDPEAATALINKLIKGVGLDERETVYVVRQRFIKERRLPVAERAELVVRAWNGFRRGEMDRAQLKLTRKKLPPVAR